METLLTVSQAARVLGVSRSTVVIWASGGRIQALYTPGGHRRFRLSDVERLKQEARADDPRNWTTLAQERKRLGLLNRQEVAQLLQVTEAWVKANGKATSPLGCKMYYGQEDVDRLRERLKDHKHPNTIRREKLRGEGWLSVADAAKRHGIPLITWRAAISRGKVPKPTHEVGLYKYYTVEEAARLADRFHKRHRPDGTFTRTELQALLGVNFKTLDRYLSHGKYGIKAGPRRCWYTQKDVQELRRQIARAREVESMYTKEQVAGKLGLTVANFNYRCILHGLKVGIMHCHRRYYSEADLALIRKTFFPEQERPQEQVRTTPSTCMSNEARKRIKML